MRKVEVDIAEMKKTPMIKILNACNTMVGVLRD